MARAELDDFVALLQKWGRRHERAEAEHFRRFPHAELVARDKVNLDIFWLKDDTLDDPDLLPRPDEIAAEIVENLEVAFDRFRKVRAELTAELDQAPATVRSQTRRVGESAPALNSRSLAATSRAKMSLRLPATVISLTGKAISPLSIQKPAAPRL